MIPAAGCTHNPGDSDSCSPAVSVLMAVYNGERFLHAAIESVLVQTLAEIELVVVDDGSTDSTPQILEGYAADDPRVVVHRQANLGRAAALNRGSALTRAPLIARLDADDVAEPDRLERQREFLAENDAVAVVGGAVTFVDASDRCFADHQYPLSDTEIRRALDHATPFVHSAVTLRKEAFAAAGGYRPVFGDADDVDLWLRLADKHQLANLPQTVVRYRLHPDQASVRGLELQTLCAVAARAAARARRAGQPDPFTNAHLISEQVLLELGVKPAEIATELVRMATWLARTMGRAGYADAEEKLFTQADEWARSRSGSKSLVAYVYRERAGRQAEQGKWLHARFSGVRAIIAQRV
jgi:hypothetical protein